MRSNFTLLPFVWTDTITQIQTKSEQQSYYKSNIHYNNLQQFRTNITKKFGISVLNYFSEHIKSYTDVSFLKDLVVFKPKESSNQQPTSIINTPALNSKKDLNLFFKDINNKLDANGIFIAYINTASYKRIKLLANSPKPLSILLSFYFLIIKFFSNKSEYSFISKAELLGRLYYNGFQVISTNQFNTRLFFTAKKSGAPQCENKKYKTIIKLKRIGLRGKKIDVYKVRSMYPYSEYIQDYVYRQNSLKAGGKFNNDFRISPLGKTLRKLWIDEIPMIFNLIKGEMKLFGVRPLSSHYYQLYPEELKILRIKTKPGLIPPFYADMPKTLEEIIQSEMNYLNKYLQSPLKTDFIYFFKALNNILIKGSRSN